LHALIAALAAWLLPVAAFAHVADEHATEAAHAWPSAWNFEAWLVALLALSAVGYAVGLRRLWGNAGRGRGVMTWQAWSFWGGWLTLVVALVSPLDSLGGVLFSAHMGQHELLMVVAAPLLVLGRPLATWAWALPPAQRRSFGRFFASRGWSGFWGALTDPLGAFALHAIALWAWHIPFAFDAALRNEGWHILQHFSFLGTALFFWWSVLGHDPRGRYGPGHSIAWLFATMMHTSALGALLSLAPSVWYEPYVATSAALGVDPVIDQQLGGLIMWVPAALAYVIAALWVIGQMLTRVRA
jgi:putative membrane protein